MDISYSTAKVNIIDINPSTEKDNKYRITKILDGDLLINKTEVLEIMDAEILKKKEEVKDLQCKKNYFITRFNMFFTEIVEGK